MLKVKQIKLVQVAARAAGLRTATDDARYRLLLGQYRSRTGGKVTTCKQLNNEQLEDFVAICEAMGFRAPGKTETYYRDKAAAQRTAGQYASFAQVETIKHLAADIGLAPAQVFGVMMRASSRAVQSTAELTRREAWKVIEAHCHAFVKFRDNNCQFPVPVMY